jgi:hypothetical protein
MDLHSLSLRIDSASGAGGVGPGTLTTTVYDSDGNTFVVTNKVYNANFNPFLVSADVLDSDGNAFTVFT